MITVELSGGLGNQLYKYATGYAVATETNQSLVIDRTTLDTIDFRDFELDGLQIKREAEISWKYRRGIFDRVILNRIRRFIHSHGGRVLRETRGACEYYPELFECAKKYKNLYLLGGWQNYKHFEKYRREISEMCVPSFELQKETLALLESIQSKESIALHVRRGDYITLGITLDDDYYFKAVHYMKEKFPNAHFFVFSEDIDFCKELFRERDDLHVTYVKHNEVRDTIVDFYLMRNCKHQIIANSSFSWWAAYTNPNEKKVILCPDGGEKDKKRNGLYPKDWIILS